MRIKNKIKIRIKNKINMRIKNKMNLRIKNKINMRIKNKINMLIKNKINMGIKNKINMRIGQGGETSCMCVCTKRVFVSNNEQKACNVVICSTKESRYLYSLGEDICLL